jgi:N-acetylmuramoyl-L-alanine amidase
VRTFRLLGATIAASILLLLGLTVGAVQLDGVGTPRIAAHSDNGFTRVVLDAPTKPKFSVKVVGKTLEMTISPARAVAGNGSIDTPELVSWELESKGQNVILTLKTTFSLSGKQGWKAFTINPTGDQPNRIVIDLGAKLSAAVSSSVTKPPSVKPIVAKPRTPSRPRLTVVLDAGHGGIDPGMIGYVMEKRVTLSLALKTQSILEKNGINVILTRDGDYAWQGVGGCDKRCDLDKRANMGSSDRNAFLSIHVNSVPPASAARAQGISTYLFGQSADAETLAQAERENGGGSTGKALTRAARNLAKDLLNDQLAQLNLKYSRKLASAVQNNLINTTGAYNLGVKQAELWVIKKPRIPSVLIEVGFGGHPVEGKNLGTTWYQQKIALGIARGVLTFLGN